MILRPQGGTHATSVCNPRTMPRLPLQTWLLAFTHPCQPARNTMRRVRMLLTATPSEHVPTTSEPLTAHHLESTTPEISLVPIGGVLGMHPRAICRSSLDMPPLLAGDTQPQCKSRCEPLVRDHRPHSTHNRNCVIACRRRSTKCRSKKRGPRDACVTSGGMPPKPTRASIRPRATRPQSGRRRRRMHDPAEKITTTCGAICTRHQCASRRELLGLRFSDKLFLVCEG